MCFYSLLNFLNPRKFFVMTSDNLIFAFIDRLNVCSQKNPFAGNVHCYFCPSQSSMTFVLWIIAYFTVIQISMHVKDQLWLKYISLLITFQLRKIKKNVKLFIMEFAHAKRLPASPSSFLRFYVFTKFMTQGQQISVKILPRLVHFFTNHTNQIIKTCL